jgi:hypothetical protein
MTSIRRNLPIRIALGLTLCAVAATAAQAQFFFQPFSYSYSEQIGPDEERPRFATPRAVSRILSRRGFALVSGLGRRGDQVVVTGVSRRDGTFRFFIDPFEGEVIHAVRLAPPDAETPPPDTARPTQAARGGGGGRAERPAPEPEKPMEPAKPIAAAPEKITADIAPKEAKSTAPGVPGRRAIVPPKAPDAAASAPR